MRIFSRSQRCGIAPRQHSEPCAVGGGARQKPAVSLGWYTGRIYKPKYRRSPLPRRAARRPATDSPLGASGNRHGTVSVQVSAVQRVRRPAARRPGAHRTVTGNRIGRQTAGQRPASPHEPVIGSACRRPRPARARCLGAGQGGAAPLCPLGGADQPALGCHAHPHRATNRRSLPRQPARSCHRATPFPWWGGRGAVLDLAFCQGPILRGPGPRRDAAGRIARRRTHVLGGGAR